jgi:TusA-related sulfurtransferase
MMERIDARGLSCPQPVINAQRKMKEMGSGTFEVIIDTTTSRDNVTRMATKEGWNVETREEGEDILLILKK